MCKVTSITYKSFSEFIRVEDILKISRLITFVLFEIHKLPQLLEIT